MAETKNFVLQEVIDELVTPEISLLKPLMKLSYFGQLVKNESLINYTSSEINGYKNDNVPDYRKVRTQLFATLQAGYNRHPHLELSLTHVQPPFRERFSFMVIHNGIATIEHSVSEMKEKPGGPLIFKIPLELLGYLQNAAKLYTSDIEVFAVEAHLEANPNNLIEILSAVRHRLLNFTMETAENFGYIIEINSFKRDLQLNNQTINNYMSTNITNSGDANVINTGAKASINSSITINKGDKKKLDETLRAHGIDDKDIENLHQALEKDEQNRDSTKVGETTNNWIGSMTAKALNGTGKILTSVTSTLLAALVKEYLGIKP